MGRDVRKRIRRGGRVPLLAYVLATFACAAAFDGNRSESLWILIGSCVIVALDICIPEGL